MARIRSVKPQLRTSLTAAEWPREVRYFWVLLWGYLDDHGRGVDDARLIKADCFPLDDDLTRNDIDEWLDLMSKPTQHDDKPALCRYEVKGRRYLHAPKWSSHQKPQHPKDTEIPPCPHHGGTSSGTPHEALTPEMEVEVEMEKGDGEGTRPADAKPREAACTEVPGKRRRTTGEGVRIPDDFAVTPAMVEWAREKAPDVNGRLETEKFVNYWSSLPGPKARKLDWQLTWRNWMLTAQTDAERRAPRASPATPTQSTTDQRVNAALAIADELRREANGHKEIAP